MATILTITDIIETKLRKEKEIEFYQQQLEEIQRKMAYLQMDLDLTNTIIKLIEQEKLLDLKRITENKDAPEV